MDPWRIGFVFSFLIIIGVFLYARRGGLNLCESILIAAPWFVTPLFYLFGNEGILVYFFDLFVPLAAYLAFSKKKFVPHDIKIAGLFILFSIGLIPLLLKSFYLVDKSEIIFNIIIFYRLIGAVSLMVYFSAIDSLRVIKPNMILRGFTWGCMLIFLAMVLQWRGILNSNVLAYTNIAKPYLIEDPEQRFIVLGLFRASLGFLGMLGVLLSFVSLKKGERHIIMSLLTGAIGIAIIILAGSKTSFLACLLVLIYPLIYGKRFLNRFWVAFIVLFLFIISIVIIVLPGESLEKVTYSLKQIILSGGAELTALDTFTTRVSRVAVSFQAIERYPEILLGFFSKDAAYFVDNLVPIDLTYFHNEYVAVLMLGGVWGICAYLIALMKIFKTLFLKINRYPYFQDFAKLTFLGSLVQGFTVNHFNPGYLFVSVVPILCYIYGLGSIVKENS